MEQIQQYPNYKIKLKLSLKNNKLTGTYTYPNKISCDDGNIVIKYSRPVSTELVKTNTIFWASRKKIYKANINKPETGRVLLERTKNIGDIVLDKEGRRIYWTEENSIYSAQQNGLAMQLERTSEEAAFPPKDLVIDHKKCA